MPSFAVTDLPQGSIDDCAPAAGWLSRQGRRFLVLAGLIAGCWLLASILNSAQASAAPVPVTVAAKATLTQTAAKLVHVTVPVTAAAAARPTRSVVNVVIAKVASTTQHVTTPVPRIVARLPRTVQGSTGGARTAAVAHRVVAAGYISQSMPQAAATASAGPRATTPRATTSHAPSSAPGRPRQPARVPLPAQPGAAGPAATNATSIGTGAGILPAAAMAPPSYLMSAASSHTAALVRTNRERPSVSPD